MEVLGRKHHSSDVWVPYESLREAAQQLGVHAGAVSSVVKGKQNHAGGFEFKLASSPDLPGEEWKTLFVISKKTKKIQVSSHGRFIDSRGKKKTPRPSSNANCRVTVNQQPFVFPRLVCAAFWGPPPIPGLQCRHKDGKRTNNHYLNLEWVTGPKRDKTKDEQNTRACLRRTFKK